MAMTEQAYMYLHDTSEEFAGRLGLILGVEFLVGEKDSDACYRVRFLDDRTEALIPINDVDSIYDLYSESDVASGNLLEMI
jgi:hypothetical protein